MSWKDIRLSEDCMKFVEKIMNEELKKYDRTKQ